MRRRANNRGKLRILIEGKSRAEGKERERERGTQFSVLLLMMADSEIIKNRESARFIIKLRIF